MPDYKNLNAGLAVVNIIGNNTQLEHALKNSLSTLQGFGNFANEVGQKLRAVGSIIVIGQSPYGEAPRRS